MLHVARGNSMGRTYTSFLHLLQRYLVQVQVEGRLA